MSSARKTRPDGSGTTEDPYQLTRRLARQIAVRAQLLTAERPVDLIDLVKHLTLLQVDPTAAIAPNADLVAWSRLGSTYRPEQLRTALADGRLIEHQATIRDRDYLRLLAADMAAWPGSGQLRDWQVEQREWVEANKACHSDILARLEAEGPLASREFPDTCAVPWRSTGWTNNRNVIRLLEFMEVRGEVAVAGRRGKERLWDLASRVHPDGPRVPAEEALLERNRRRLAALGLARAKGPFCGVDQSDVGQAGLVAVVEGVKGQWRVDPDALTTSWFERPSGHPRTALLSPFDRLVHDRVRLAELFEFEYQLEMYKPVAKRRWGYFALPVLHGDRLVGKLDAKADRKAGALVVHALHEDQPFDAETGEAVRAEVHDLAGWLGLDVRWP